MSEKPLVDSVDDLLERVQRLEDGKPVRKRFRWSWRKPPVENPIFDDIPRPPPELSKPLIEEVAELSEKVKVLEAGGPVKEKRFKIKVKVPWKIRSKIKREKVGVVWLGANRILDFRTGTIQGGLIKIEGLDYDYEPEAVYRHKKWPFVVVFEWRLVPAGGSFEEYRNRVIGGKSDIEEAERLKITNYAQQTIIRAIAQAELAKDEKKKMSMNIVWIVLGVIAVGYILLKLLGGL
jgi:hypothetical protein